MSIMKYVKRKYYISSIEKLIDKLTKKRFSV